MVVKLFANIGQLTLLDQAPKRSSYFKSMHPEIVSSKAQIAESVRRATKESFFVSYKKGLTEALVKSSSRSQSSLGVGLFMHSLDAKAIPALASRFRQIAFMTDTTRGGGFLPPEELAEVLGADNRDELFIGGSVDCATETVTFWKGNRLDPLTVPFSAFPESGDGTKPDFDRFSVTDYGQTVQLGDYEAAVDAILYENDPEYRRRISKRRLKEERSFGASVRRLRKQRGLRREDFEPGITAKTVARIEQGKVNRIQSKTRNVLALRLGVAPEELGTF